ncbi:MAG: indolepyruvate oxidoreductase subunit beta [Clostridia bacterium]|nr:indolepyruvate oxidoreductase subunit beta [Clostridia bacterium]
MSNNTTSIMIVGVGGQGTLLASRLLGNTAVSAGYDVKVSEVHGMSQRGGSVVTYVRYGDQVYSPIVEKGGADVILAFEELEAYRWIEYLKPEGTLIVNTQQKDPMPVITGAMEYPKNILQTLRDKGIHTVTVDALEKARQAGTVKAVNVVLMGVFAAHSPMKREQFEAALTATVPQKFLEVNQKAFALGYESV